MKMEPNLLIWGLLTFIIKPGCLTEICDDNPPEVKYATFKASAYKHGTMLNCECKERFRRKNGSPFVICAGNPSHPSWDDKCQCESMSPENSKIQVTPQPKEQKRRKTTEMQSHKQPMDQVNLLGHCKDHPPWEHEGAKRIYHFVVGQTVHYQCIQGYRPLRRVLAKSVCEMTCGKTRWTQPRLKCINASEHSPFPDVEESQENLDAPAESETSCPFTTTDLPKSTEVVTTMEPFVFTTEYQVAVAGCVLLLICVLLLSGLTWQQRWRKTRSSI